MCKRSPYASTTKATNSQERIPPKKAISLSLMLTIISCAKMFRKPSQLASLAQDHPCTTARYMAHSQSIAQAIANTPAQDLEKQLKVKPPVAEALLAQMQHFGQSPTAPALLAYHGVAYKSLAAEDYSPSDWQQAQAQLRICSFLYGLLRPLDGISNYRLEGKFKLATQTVFQSWKEELTQSLITDSQAAGGTLCQLASKEMQQLFDWKKLKQELHLITPDFLIEEKGKCRICSVRSKQARGSMASAIIQQQWKSATDLQQWGKVEGYELREADEHRLLFVKNID